MPDNVSIKFGTGGDSRLYYDGTDLVISPAEVGTGELKVSGASLSLDAGEKIDFGAGDVMLTHASNRLTLYGGDFQVADGNGIVIGHTDKVTTASTKELQVLGTTGADGGIIIGRWGNNPSQPNLEFLKSRSTSIGSFAIVHDNDILGHISWYGDDGNDYGSYAARISVEVDGTPGSNDMPGRMTFSTTPDGASAPTERLRIDSAGGVFINESANANMTVGLTINQGANDDEILALKSSDVGHPMTSITEGDTYGDFLKVQVSSGGLLIRGFKDSGGVASGAVQIEAALGETASTTDTSSGRGVLEFIGEITDGGTGRTVVADAGNLLAFVNRTTTRAILKGNGDWHVATLDGSSVAGTVLDDMPDALAGRALRTEIASQDLRHGVNVYDPGLVRSLEDHGVISEADESGNRFMSLQGATYFAWDMGFQNAMWLRDIVNVLTDKQRDRLPTQTREMLALMPGALT
ncbi:MAG: hypothetical protein IIB27_07790 [Chloroflexi bacterium]|nr:hypothetical protein [Chloroflexota bacterium]